MPRVQLLGGGFAGKIVDIPEHTTHLSMRDPKTFGDYTLVPETQRWARPLMLPQYSTTDGRGVKLLIEFIERQGIIAMLPVIDDPE